MHRFITPLRRAPWDWLLVTVEIALGGAVAAWACGASKPATTSSSTLSSPTSTLASVTAVSVTGAAPRVGAVSQFTATATFSDSTTRDVTAQAAWSSSSPSVATVSAGGALTGVGPGDTNVAAVLQNVGGQEHVTIPSTAFRISGIVTDGTSGGILPNIIIAITDGPSAQKSAMTGGDGTYAIADVQPGTMTLVASAVSYDTTAKSVTIAGDTRVDFVLPRTAPPSGPAQCDGSLWNHVYDPARLQMKQSCITVTGTVTDFHTNDDGDIDIRLDVDPQYKNLLNAGNISNLSGHLQTEAICQTTPTTADSIQACGGFRGSVPVPPVGAHVQVTGSYVYDSTHGWMEVHPVSALSVR